MTTNIYDQHRAAFANVSAYVVLDKKGERAASVAFKYPRDGAGRLFCYLHIFGGPMVRGFAGGGGYDKHSAAASAAASKLKLESYYEESQADVTAIRAALLVDGGSSWDGMLRDAGYNVLQAV